MPPLFMPRKVSSNPPLLIPDISTNLNPVKLGLTDVNDILTLTNIQGSLDLNQIIPQRKIKNQLGKCLDVQCLSKTRVSVTYDSSHLLSHIPLAWVKDSESKKIEFGNRSNRKSKQKVDISLQLQSYKEKFQAYAMTIPEYDIVLGHDWYQRNRSVINWNDLSIVIQDQKRIYNTLFILSLPNVPSEHLYL